MELLVIAAVLVAAIALYFWGYNSRDKEAERFESSVHAILSQHLAPDTGAAGKNQSPHGRARFLLSRTQDLADSLSETKKQLSDSQEESRRIFDVGVTRIDLMRSQSALLPSMVMWADLLRDRLDRAKADFADSAFRVAPKAEERVREATQRARLAERERDSLLNRIAFYESQAPWLPELEEMSLDDLLASLKQQQAIDAAVEDGDDPVRVLLSPTEYAGLNSVARNQLALDRFDARSRARTAWAAGIEYERFIGFTLEREGWSVEYHGAEKGRADLGLDLICTRGAAVLAVQCKRLSPTKGIPVRENVIAQTFGAARYLGFLRGIEHSAITPLLVTSYILSDEARRFAGALGVEVKENLSIASYPRIKCNISRRTGERIYHLPFDQQYDSTVIDESTGEAYVATVAEAERLGFRRAFRWRGQ